MILCALLCICFFVNFLRLACVFCFFFKQKTAYEMRISDWSSDVCSSDLGIAHMKLSRSGANYVVSLDCSEPVNRHRPSVDVLFHSAAHVAGKNAVEIGRASCRERVCQYV